METIKKLPFYVGDYVKVINTGEQYPTYKKAFMFFWGDIKTTELKRYLDAHPNGNVWKVMNFATHEHFDNEVIVHIRSIEGNNAAIGLKGISLLPFHKRNRSPMSKKIVIKQL